MNPRLSKAPGVPSGITPREGAPAPATRPRGNRRVLVSESGTYSTLSGIAGEVYGNANAWPKIYNANLGKIKNPSALTPGISLVIP